MINMSDELFELCRRYIDLCAKFHVDKMSMDRSYELFRKLSQEIHLDIWKAFDCYPPRNFIHDAMEKIPEKHHWITRIFNGEKRNLVVWDYADRLTKVLMKEWY